MTRATKIQILAEDTLEPLSRTQPGALSLESRVRYLVGRPYLETLGATLPSEPGTTFNMCLCHPLTRGILDRDTCQKSHFR